MILGVIVSWVFIAGGVYFLVQDNKRSSIRHTIGFIVCIALAYAALATAAAIGEKPEWFDPY